MVEAAVHPAEGHNDRDDDRDQGQRHLQGAVARAAPGEHRHTAIEAERGGDVSGGVARVGVGGSKPRHVWTVARDQGAGHEVDSALHTDRQDEEKWWGDPAGQQSKEHDQYAERDRHCGGVSERGASRGQG